MNIKTCFLVLFSLGLFVGCSSILKVDKQEELQLKSDLDQRVVIEEVKPTQAEFNTDHAAPPPPPLLKEEKAAVKTKTAVKKSSKKIEPVVLPWGREPSIEDGEGFYLRRPLQDPFRVGEVIKHEVFYNLFRVTAGEMEFQTLPFKVVNGRKAYQFQLALKTTSLFSSFYAVDDKVVTLIDYDLWLPRLYSLHVKESSQLREARSYFDFEKLKAVYEEKKITSKKGVEEKRQEWEILPYSQNVFSVIYYMRLFAWKDGKEYSFRVADDGENLVFKGKVVSRETLKTPIGEMKAIKIKPEFTVKGAFKPVGDIYIWLSDDARKIPLRIESKIKIGTIISQIMDYQPGSSP
ncbi:MAG: DUF3108 domain-containing protein [Bdellovibrionales bacterium]